MNNGEKIYGPLGFESSKQEILLTKDNVAQTLVVFSTHLKKTRFLSEIDYNSIKNLLKQVPNINHQNGYVPFWIEGLKTELAMFSLNPYHKGSYLRDLNSKFFLQQEPKHSFITDATTTDVLTIAFFDQKIFNDILMRVKSIISQNEFQVHYCSLLYTLKFKNGKIVNFNFPVFFFNFKQRVSTVSVNYETKDEDEILNSFLNNNKSVIDSASKKLTPVFKLLTDSTHLEIESMTVSFLKNGSFHRHPSKFSFSATDRSKDPKNPGIIYNIIAEGNKPRLDSVVTVEKNDQLEIFTTEARLMDCRRNANDVGITGTYTKHPILSVLMNGNPDALTTTEFDFSIFEEKVDVVESINETPFKLLSENISINLKQFSASNPFLLEIIKLLIPVVSSITPVLDIESSRIEGVQHTYNQLADFLRFGRRKGHKNLTVPNFNEDLLRQLDL